MLLRSLCHLPTFPLAVILTAWSMLTKSLDSLEIRLRSSKIGRKSIIYTFPVFDSVCSPDLHSQQTTTNLAALLVAPINSYQSVLTLLALTHYVPLLNLQTFSTRRTLAHSIVSSVLKNETVIEAPEDVNGILELCHVLIKEQQDAGVGIGSTGPAVVKDQRRHGPYGAEREDLAEEQGWLARMVHLFRAESLSTQFEVEAHHAPFSFHLTSFLPQLAPTKCTETLRSRRRAHALHLPCSHHLINQTLPSI